MIRAGSIFRLDISAPAQQVSAPDRVHYERLAVFDTRLRDDLPPLDQIEAIGHVAFTQDCVSFLPLHEHGAVREQRELLVAHARGKGMRRHFHRHFLVPR